MVRAGQYLLLEFTRMGLAHENQSFLDFLLRHDLRLFEIAPGPTGDDVGDVDRVGFPAQQMIGAG